MSIDTLSEVLRAVRLTGAIFFDVSTTSPWVAEAPPAREVAPLVLPGAQHVIEYHVVHSGSCWAGIVGEPAVRLGPGDVIAFPQGDPHVLSSEPGLRGPADVERHRRPADGQLPIRIEDGGGGPDGAHVVCGFLGCDAGPFNPLLGALPRMIRVAGDADGGGWLAQLTAVAVAESRTRGSGSQTVLARLSELLFVEVVRRHWASLPDGQTGWLAGLRDPHVGRALGSLHERPLHAWTLDELARTAGLSRSALAERFVELVGVPPIEYLAKWRMQLAAAELSSSTRSIAEIAARVGYGSEAAFSRAFKRLVGVAPSAWRQSERAPHATARPRGGDGA